MRSKSLNGFAADALAKLMTYDYEGNIRELKNIVEYAVNVANTSVIEPENLPSYLFETIIPSPQPSSLNLSSTKNFDAVNHMSHQNIPLNQNENQQVETWPTVQRKMILDALKKAKGKKNEAARILGWGRSTLWRKIKQYELDP